MAGRVAGPEVFALNQESRILGKWSNPVSGSRKSQASSPWAKQHRVPSCSIMEKPHTGLDECPRILLSYSRARNSGPAPISAGMFCHTFPIGTHFPPPGNRLTKLSHFMVAHFSNSSVEVIFLHLTTYSE